MRGSRRANITDVAKASGVGVGTVSRVINGAANVREATRLRVLQVVEQLGYQPSHLAAALARGTTRTVGIVVPRLVAPSVTQRLAGALTVLNAEGYETVVCNVDSPAQRDHFLSSLPGRHRTDGVIVVSLPLRADHVAAFRHAAVPLVTVDVSVRGVPHTIIDNLAGGRLVAEHLLALGHTRIGFVGDRVQRKATTALGFTASDRRLVGLLTGLAAAGVAADPSLIRTGPHGPAHAESFATELLALPDPPTAIFAASDSQALGVLAAADRLGVAVPGQLSVIGFDDIQIAGLVGLSTVRQPLEDSGAEGARRLCALIRGQPVKPLRQLLALQVVPRKTTNRAGQGRADSPAESATAPGPAFRATGRIA
ncbi:MAG TPA: LacI family DNA-binding transcriptional regulator [Streptosporangiaceae bacterium]|nr:LacI family DNA-binding transcriptional regulator [Streptosporangiaceae bacterium]